MVKCQDKFDRLDKLDVDFLAIKMDYLQELVEIVDASNDCDFWFDDYGEYTRLKSPDARGLELTNLVSIDHSNLSDLDERQRKLDKIIGSLFKLPPFYENPLGIGHINDLEKRVMTLYFSAFTLYAALDEKFIKLVSKPREKYSLVKDLWKFEIATGDPMISRPLKPSGELYVKFAKISKKFRNEYDTITIAGKRYTYNSLQIYDTYMGLQCIIIELKGEGNVINCRHF